MQNSYGGNRVPGGEGGVLVLEGALDPPGVALVGGGEVLAAADVDREAGPRGGLGAMAASLLARPEARELTGLVVDCGPGSFTGLRIALSLARGLLAGIEGLETRGVDALRLLVMGAGGTLPAWVAIPWGRLRVLLARVDRDGRMSGEVIARQALVERKEVAGAEVVTTSGGLSLDFPASTRVRALEGSPVAALARLVVEGRLPAVAGGRLEPIYLVPPDAVLPATGPAPAVASLTTLGPPHLHGLEDLLRTAFERPWSPAMVREEVACTTDRRVIGCQDRDGRLEAAIFLRWVGENLEILNLAVRPDCRRRGLGRTLVRAAIDLARELELRQVDLEVAESNRPAVALYETEGFVPVGRRPGYYPDGGAALLMSLVLRRHRSE